MAFPEKQLITSYETFLILRKGDPVFYEKEIQNVFVESRVPLGSTIHPTEKPVALMERLLRLTSVPGETVADPTAGSGSVLEAAYRAFRKPLGCELERSFYERALMRLTEVMK
jgi:site-specific DNA-methyltransferase (adenine-specific)